MTETFIQQVLSELLTRPQRAEVKRMTLGGYSRTEAIRRLIRLGVLVRHYPDLETDLIHGTNYVVKR